MTLQIAERLDIMDHYNRHRRVAKQQKMNETEKITGYNSSIVLVQNYNRDTQCRYEKSDTKPRLFVATTMYSGSALVHCLLQKVSALVRLLIPPLRISIL